MIDNVVVVQLDKLTAKHVLPGFTDRTFEERQIEELTTEITQVQNALLALTALLK